MTSIQALREQRAARAKSLNELVNKAGGWNEAVDAAVYASGMAEIDALDAQIDRINAVNAKLADDTVTNNVADRIVAIGHNSGQPALVAYGKWLRGGDRALNTDDWGAIRNIMSTTTSTEGGFTVATEVATTILDALKKFGGMRENATVIATSGGAPMSFPTSDGVLEEGEIVAENVSATDADATFGTIALPVYKYSSKVITVPVELLSDSNVDIEAFVRTRLVTRLGRVTNRHFTTGTGVNQPRGLVVAAPIGVTGAVGTTVSVGYDSLVDLVHSVDPAYREAGACKFMMNDTTVRDLRKIKDTTGRPIFAPGYESGNPGSAPDTLLGHPIAVNQSMAVMAANALSILFGDLTSYVIRDAMSIELQRYTDSAYAKKGQVGFLAWLRSGGNSIDIGGAVKSYRNSAT